MRLGWWFASCVLLLVDCSSTSSTNNVDRCSPGEEVECRVDGCSGLKACRPDGNGYEPCVCGGGGSAGSDGSGGDGAAGGDDSNGGAGAGKGGGGAGKGGAGTGGSAGDGAAGDGGAAGASPRCDINAPFEGVQPLNDINGPGDELHGSLSEDLLTLHFDGSATIYRATRTTPDGLFEQITPLPVAINMPGVSTPHVSRDGRALFFARQGDLFRATRSNVSAEFGMPTLLANVNSNDNEWMSSVSGDETLLFFHSDQNGDSDLYTATLVSAGTYGTPVPLDELNSLEGDTDAKVTADGLAVYFSSERPPSQLSDVWVTRRSSVDNNFGAPELVASLNTTNYEWPTWIASDECMIVIGRNALDVNGADLFVATRPTSP